MTEREIIAERTLYAVEADGHEYEIHLMIGKPYPVDTGEWVCPVTLPGAQGRLTDIRGVDSWQALMLSTRAIRELLGHFVDVGVKLLSEAGGEEISVGDVFWDGATNSEPEVPQPDGPLTMQERSLVDELSDEELRAIDEAILASCSVQFRKVARVVGSAMQLNSIMDNCIPDAFYAQRVYKMVEDGRLTYQGMLGYMRFCEVRLPSYGD